MSNTAHGPLHYWNHLVQELKTIGSRSLLSGVSNAINILEAGAPCDCLLTDDGDTKSGHNSAFCPHDNPLRTYELLPIILSELDPAVEELEVLRRRITERVKASRERWQSRDERASQAVRKWLLDASQAQGDPNTAPLASSSLGVFLNLPLELLVNIFIKAQENDPDLHLRLSLVSTGFRQMVLNTPMLWATIDIMHPNERINSSLRRSGDAFLHVRMSIPPIFAVTDGRVKLDRFVSKLRPHFHRIQHLRMIYIHEEWVDDAAVVIREISFPNLRSLDAGALWGSANWVLPPSPYSDLTHAYIWKIHDLCLRHPVIADLHILPSTISWTRLRLVEPAPFTLLMLLNLLGRTPDLEYLALEDWELAEPSEPNEIDTGGNTIILPNLETIELVRSYSRDLVAIAQTVLAPNLNALDLVIDTMLDTDQTVWGEENYGRALARMADAYPQIHRLIVSGCILSSERWSELLHSFHLLTYLRLSGCILQKADLAALIGEAPLPLACPALKEIAIENEFELQSSTIVKLLARRDGNSHPDVARVRSVTMKGWPRNNVADEDIITIRSRVDEFTIGFFFEDSSDDDYSDEDRDEEGDDETTDSRADSIGSTSSDGWTSGDEEISTQIIED